MNAEWSEQAARWVSNSAEDVARHIKFVADTYENPSVLWRPKLSIDGDMWCALYGEDLQTGLCGFGDSPAEAMRSFDRAFYTKTSQQNKKIGQS